MQLQQKIYNIYCKYVIAMDITANQPRQKIYPKSYIIILWKGLYYILFYNIKYD